MSQRDRWHEYSLGSKTVMQAEIKSIMRKLVGEALWIALWRQACKEQIFRFDIKYFKLL